MSAPRPRLRLHQGAPAADVGVWIERIAAGDEASLTALYHAVAGRVFGLALRVVGDRHVAEEVVVDTFTQLWQRAKGYVPARGDATAWVLRIARNRAIDRRRELRRHGDCTRQEIADLALEVFGREAQGDDATARAESGEQVRRAAASLPRGQREALAATFLAGMTQQEAARALAVPLGTIKSRVRDGLLALKRALANPAQEIR